LDSDELNILRTVTFLNKLNTSYIKFWFRETEHRIGGGGSADLLNTYVVCEHIM
jgi:hypothetical protein